MTTTVKNYSVNLAKTEIINFRVVESKPPKPPTSQLQYVVDQQIIAPLARGVVNGTAIQMSNLNFSHVCDFRFIVGFSFTDLLGIPNFVGLIGQAIKNAKLRAAAKIRSAIQQVIDFLRTALEALVNAVGFDPSGQLSYFFSVGKDILYEINYYAKKIAQFIEDILVWVEVFKQISAIIAYIQSLPARIKAMVAACLTNFFGSVKNLVNQVTNLPNTVLGQVQRVVSNVDSQAQSALNQLSAELGGVNQSTTNSNQYVLSQQATQRGLQSNSQQILVSSLTSYAKANTNEELVTLSSRDTKAIEQFNTQLTTQSQEAFSNSSNNLTVTVGPAFDSANTKRP